MKCLSVKQPFAELIVSGRKTIELRGWNTKFRGQFLVHASGNVDAEACRLFGMDEHALPRKALVGKAFLYDVREYKNADELARDQDKHLSTGAYASKYGFLLKDASRIKPVNRPGALGFFEANI